ncbi:sugar phosphate isomerase/epimerase [Sphingobacterium sp. SGG-5]|uniref:sugar phosphate isomerase/epimerase family protein n=1 Tax=Sphingobacterium sp. SGG-5 TaxID=2710881 RepID=UPI0013EAFFC7|nr:sugar phosphate isomerase/epimerase family protein [Sphingobacterium sp. SGG-5]NGM61466.1 sugar phosphate isomerase/epimerase [Sphingobacterium sp. SGG-5]
MNTRREFIKTLGLVTGGVVLAPSLEAFAAKKPWFEISLAEWSLHRTLRKGELDNLDFPAFAKKEFGIHAVEYVNQFFKDKAQDFTYLKELKKRAKDQGVKNVLIMVDGEGQLGDANTANRTKAVENHYKWVDAAKYLGCHAIRVNAAGKGEAEEVKKRVIDSMVTLADYAKKAKINVIIENHGGMSSHGDWLADILKQVNRKNAGSLPDFGNFYEYDRYQGVTDLMPFAKGVSAKTHDFEANGLEKNIDYAKMLDIVKSAGYKGYIGIEYEGKNLSEVEGIKATKALLERYR